MGSTLILRATCVLALWTSGCGALLGLDDTYLDQLADGGPSASRPRHPRDTDGSMPPTGGTGGSTAGSSSDSAGRGGTDSRPSGNGGMDGGMDATATGQMPGPMDTHETDAGDSGMDAKTKDVEVVPETGPDTGPATSPVPDDPDAGSEDEDTGPPPPKPHVWTPADLDQLVLWLDAAHGVELDGSRANPLVARWADQSGHGNDAVRADVNGQPAWRSGAGPNGLPAIVFTATNNTYLQIPEAPELLMGTDDFTLEVVAAWTNPTVVTTLGAGYGALVIMAAMEADRGWRMWGNTLYERAGTRYLEPRFGLQFAGFFAASAANDLNDGLFRVLAANRIGGTLLQTRVNGLPDFNYNIPPALNPDSAFPGFMLLGGSSGDVSQALNGAIAEVILVRGQLPHQQLQQLERYLLDKYGF